MKRFERLLLLVLLSSLTVFGQNTDPIAGAWEQIGVRNLATGTDLPRSSPPVHAIYSNGHFVQFTAPANRQKLQKVISEMTREELIERFQGMQGQYGTYRVEGNKLIRKVQAAANPNNEGTENTSEFRVEGDTLILTNTSPQGQPSEIRYRRLR